MSFESSRAIATTGSQSGSSRLEFLPEVCDSVICLSRSRQTRQYRLFFTSYKINFLLIPYHYTNITYAYEKNDRK